MKAFHPWSGPFAKVWLMIRRMPRCDGQAVLQEHRLAELETVVALGWDA